MEFPPLSAARARSSVTCFGFGCNSPYIPASWLKPPPRVGDEGLSAHYYVRNYLAGVVILEVIYLLGGEASMGHFFVYANLSSPRATVHSLARVLARGESVSRTEGGPHLLSQECAKGRDRSATGVRQECDRSAPSLI